MKKNKNWWEVQNLNQKFGKGSLISKLTYYYHLSKKKYQAKNSMHWQGQQNEGFEKVTKDELSPWTHSNNENTLWD